jgi:hypothetical protein
MGKPEEDKQREDRRGRAWWESCEHCHTIWGVTVGSAVLTGKGFALDIPSGYGSQEAANEKLSPWLPLKSTSLLLSSSGANPVTGPSPYFPGLTTAWTSRLESTIAISTRRFAARAAGVSPATLGSDFP